MRRIWDTFPWWNEKNMLQMHLEEVGDYVDKIVLVEAPVTFGGDAKPLLFKLEYAGRWADKIIYVEAEIPETDNPWVREYAQRDAAWQAILEHGADLEDVVIVEDVDEIPSREALAWRGWPVTSLQMRTALYAVDWLVPDSYRVPPMAVMATVRWIKSKGGQLAKIREERGAYPVIQNGGWHFSWLGGPDQIALKLATGTSHYDLRGRSEAVMINNGERWRSGTYADGIPVEPADVDSTWPAFITEGRCPAAWLRPRGKDFIKPAAMDPPEIREYLWSGYEPGALAFEVGANQGTALPRMQYLYKRVVGFEPYTPAYEIACMMPDAEVRNVAVGDYDGRVELTLADDQLISHEHESYMRLNRDENSKLVVDQVTLDAVMDELGVPDFVNVDVEGSEEYVLKGATRLLLAGKASWLIEFHSKALHEACVRILETTGSCKVETVRHPHYAPGSQFYDQHGWIKAVPCATD